MGGEKFVICMPEMGMKTKDNKRLIRMWTYATQHLPQMASSGNTALPTLLVKYLSEKFLINTNYTNTTIVPINPMYLDRKM